MQRITILGATGSIGRSTLAVIAEHPDRYHVFALTARQNIALLTRQCIAFRPNYAVVATDEHVAHLQRTLADSGCTTEVLCGVDALCEVARHRDVDTVMAAIVGAAGLKPTLAAVQSGKRVLLANKEALVMSGRLMMDEVQRSQAVLLPIDSEHNAIFQCLPSEFDNLEQAGISGILLTGSGGPFRAADAATLGAVTPAQACAHPNWSMGRKISVDSATMMNKGLELIEACWLFNTNREVISVLIHPQSIVHSMVQYVDGSVLAQLGNPDMRTPIAHCLAWPHRICSGVPALDFAQLSQLTFEEPDWGRFPCLKLAMEAAAAGQDYAVALNAANEIAVDLFLQETIGYTKIASLISETLENWAPNEPESIDDVIEADLRARRQTQSAAKNL